MQIPMNVLIIGAVQLLLLIAIVYMVVFLKLYYRIHFPEVDVFLLVIQVSNLILLLHCATRSSEIFLVANGNIEIFLITQGILITLLLLRFVWLFRKLQACRKKLLMPRSIRETIDYLPGGLCFSTPNGTPILTNYKMNELVFQLTDSTIMNARTTWEELRQFDAANGCVKLEELRIDQDRTGESVDECMHFLFPDNSVWRFRKKELTDRLPYYAQLEATDISDLHRYSKELYGNNQRLAEQYARQQSLLANIVEVNREKEILSTKMRVHDDLGRSIITTKQHLSNQTLSENISNLAEIWNNIIRNLSDFTQIYADIETSPEDELQRAADMIGCHIIFHGNRPTERTTILLFYTAVREALTNAVRHANADQLNVTIRPTDRGYHLEISDNGNIPVPYVAEGNGLSNLRQRLEQEGATLQVKCENGVALIMELPAERKDTSAQEGE